MKVNKILVVRNDRFGEFLLNIPALNALKRTYQGVRLTLVVDPYVRELAQSIGCVDEVITWERGRHRVFEMLKFSAKLKKQKFDLCVILNPSKEFNIISFLAGIPKRIGYVRKWSFLLTDKIIDNKRKALKHEVEYNLELVSLVGARPEDKLLSLNINDSLVDYMIKNVGIEEGVNLIAIHPFTSDSIKQWPIENFARLSEKLIAEFNTRIIIVGSRQDISKEKIFLEMSDRNIVNLIGKTSLIQLAAILKRCKLLISGDSGPMHLAASVGIPVAAIFRSDISAKSSRRWGPWGSRHRVIEKNSLESISVEEVFNLAKEILCREDFSVGCVLPH